MLPKQKIWNISQSKAFLDQIKEQTFVLCYGYFNIIHPGHIRYLEYAKLLGGKLIVLVQGDGDTTHSDNPQNFSAHERALGLASLLVVDYVIILDSGELSNAIQLLRPNSLVLGKEFQKDRHGLVEDSLNELKKTGGKVVYHAGKTNYATTNFLDEWPGDIQSERWRQFHQACRRQKLDQVQILEALERFKQCQLLVLGDTIVDQYVACDALGLSTEAPVMVVREHKTREYLGGGAIVAAHARSLGAQCHYLSVVGNDANSKFVQKKLQLYNVSQTLIHDSSRPTTFKIRYMVENQKLFRVSRLNEHSLSADVESQVIKRLKELAPKLDGILVSDFVYGVITEDILFVLQQLKKQYGLKLFGDLQCSSQVGNIAKFKNFDLLTPTEKEARIALGNRDDGVEWVANHLMRQSKTNHLIIKLGSDGFIVYTKEKKGFVNRQHFPALCTNPIDVTGAGDSLLACTATSLSAGNTMMVSAALGACIASIAVQRVGNLPIDYQTIRYLISKQF